mmetsp:Transcript_22155/g.68045  ORF Transcript_22155/g.68045 Transcript_22155/m.68045 type:complete len:96 (+) Transcript_22155:500-787(+)
MPASVEDVDKLKIIGAVVKRDRYGKQLKAMVAAEVEAEQNRQALLERHGWHESRRRRLERRFNQERREAGDAIARMGEDIELLMARILIQNGLTR